MWEHQQHGVCRLYHTERTVEYADAAGQWHHGTIADARREGRTLATCDAELEVRKSGQPHAKRQSVTVRIQAGPIRLTYDTNIRRPGTSVQETRVAWLVEVLPHRRPANR